MTVILHKTIPNQIAWNEAMWGGAALSEFAVNNRALGNLVSRGAALDAMWCLGVQNPSNSVTGNNFEIKTKSK